MKSLREKLKDLGVPEKDMSNYCSDLQVLFTKKRFKIIKDLVDYPQNIERHLSNVKGQKWFGKSFIEIPFAYTEYYNE